MKSREKRVVSLTNAIECNQSSIPNFPHRVRSLGTYWNVHSCSLRASHRHGDHRHYHGLSESIVVLDRLKARRFVHTAEAMLDRLSYAPDTACINCVKDLLVPLKLFEK
jgi:hypothetical protein